jgi:alcohol dehydrogenase class IV
MSQFYNPVRLFLGAESLNEFVQYVNTRYRDVHRVLLLTRGGGVEEDENLREVLAVLQGKEVVLRELGLANPDIGDIYALKRELDSFDFELVIAIGGGSVLDAAKALVALQDARAESAEDIRERIVRRLYCRKEKITPWIGFATTSGTGSEVTCWATVWDKALGVKYSISDERLYARAAVMLPKLTAMMPLKLSATTALDAICHATEAYWSIRSNAIVRHYALQAIERIRVFLPQLKHDPANLLLRSELSLASLYAGLAFSNTRTTACHSISYPLTMLYGIEHGVAASMTLGSVLKLNWNAMVEPENLLRAFGVGKPEEVQRVMMQLFELYDIPVRLGDYGITADQVGKIVARAYTKGRMDNNPVPISEETLEKLLIALI